MKKSLFFCLIMPLLLAGLVACQDEQAAPEQRLRIRKITDPTKSIVLQYNGKGQLDNLVVSDGNTTNLVLYLYNGDQLVSYNYFYSTSPDTTNPQNGYKAKVSTFAVTNDPSFDKQVSVYRSPFAQFAQTDFAPSGLLPDRQLISLRSKANKVYQQQKESPNSVRSRQLEVLQYTYLGENVASESSQYNGVGLVQNQQRDLTYDTKRNPYFNLFLPRIDPAQFSSLANVTKEVIQLSQGPYATTPVVTTQTINYTYEYNEQGYPTVKRTVGSTDVTRFEYEVY